MHDNGGGLHPHVASHRRNERNEQRKFRVAFNVECPNDVGTAHTATKADEEPRQSRPGQRPDAVSAFHVFRDSRGELVVALGIFNHHVDGIVDGDPSHEQALVIHHGKGDEVVTFHQLDHHFFAFVRPHRHELVVVLQVAQHRACGGGIQQQALQ